MATPSVRTSVFKLAMAGEQAGFTVEQMIAMLNSGVSVEGLLLLVEWKLTHAPLPEFCPSRSSRWIM